MGYTIGIAGYGVVGKHMHTLFPSAKVYDKYTGPHEDLNGADFVFICVPTPWTGSGLDCTEVENVVATIDAKCFIIRSATQVGFYDYLVAKYRKTIVIQPEYLGESPNHPNRHQVQPKFLTFGGEPDGRRSVINLYATIFNSNIGIRQLSGLEAEIVKVSENRAIFFKVMQMQELYDACESHGVDYYTIRDAVYGDDPRLDLGWSFIYPDSRGANSKCIPKDVYAWLEWASEAGFNPTMTATLLQQNELLIGRS